MPPKLNAVKPLHASPAVADNRPHSDESDGVDGAFDEGNANTNSASAALAYLCPTTVRLTVGMYSVLTAVGGCVMCLMGANGLYNVPDPDSSLHSGLLGGGLALVASGGFGIASTFLQRPQAHPYGATA